MTYCTARPAFKDTTLVLSSFYKRITLLFAFVVLSGCANLQQSQPDILLVGITPQAGQSIAPEFNIKLKVVNPTDSEVRIKGVSAKVYLQGHRVAAGVTGKMDPIASFSDGMVSLTASSDLFGGIGFIYDMVNSGAEKIDYRLELSISQEGRLIPIKVVETGQFDLSKLQKK